MSFMKKIKIIICDDHPLIIAGISNFLKDKENMEMLGEATSREELFSLMEENAADIVILDINLKHENGVEICGEITSKFPNTKVIGLSNLDDQETIVNMLNNGAYGYLVKNAPLSEIETAIRSIHNGDMHLGREAQLALTQFSKIQSQTIPPTTMREKDVLRWLAEGLTSAEIGEKLFISPQTVDSHRKNLMKKFEVNKTVNLVASAKKYGLI